MDLKTFNFPTVSRVDLVFPTFDTIPELKKEAEKRGFSDDYNPYNKFASQLFLKGGELRFKKDIPEDFKLKATNYLKVFMRSFAPKHEDKTMICALLLSELVDL